jgi:hypothetical protein
MRASVSDKLGRTLTSKRQTAYHEYRQAAAGEALQYNSSG